MELKPGYKQTEIGVIPDDWGALQIGSIGDPLIGLTYSPSDVREQGSLVLRASNIQNGRLYLEDTVFVEMEIPERMLVRDRDLLICVRNGSRQLIGKSLLLDNSVQGSTFGAFMSVIRSEYSQFIHYLFQTEIIQRQIAEVMGATINQLTNKNLREFIIPVPNDRREQEAIAEALSDVDELIESLEQIIAKKSLIKQGMMQVLLSGKDRLRGFSGKWKSERLGNLGNFLKGSGVNKSQTMSGSLPCIRYGEIYTRHSVYVKNFHSWISREVAEKATRLLQGDLLFAGSGETKEEIGKCVAFTHDVEAYAGGDVIIFRSDKECDPLFLGYYLNTAQITNQKASKGQGDAVVHISASALANLECFLPELDEQVAIGIALYEIDAEIDAIKAKLTKSRHIKCGMMQQLLTGKIRLVPVQSNVIQFKPKKAASASSASKGHNQHFNEAIVISVLTSKFATSEFPLGRKRRTKLQYLLHRRCEGEANGFLKKAAGPYNPAIRYKGAEAIAIKNGYVKQHKHGGREGFIAGEKSGDAQSYFERWYGTDVLIWIEQFHYCKNDDLELLTTVDMAMVDLAAKGATVGLDSVKDLINSEPEWAPKLDRVLFSDQNMERAIIRSNELFGKR